MANTLIKPDVANVTGLLQTDSHIGTNVPNARVATVDVSQDDTLRVSFTAKYFWNQAAYTAWKADPNSVQPFYRQRYDFQGDDNSSARQQALAWLLTQPPFNGVSTLLWVAA